MSAEQRTKEPRLNCDLRPDAQAFDEVRIVTVPRYKQSGLSGDEWRISAAIRLYRKDGGVGSDYIVIGEHGTVTICVNGVAYGKTAERWHELARRAEKASESLPTNQGESK